MWIQNFTKSKTLNGIDGRIYFKIYKYDINKYPSSLSLQNGIIVQGKLYFSQISRHAMCLRQENE